MHSTRIEVFPWRRFYISRPEDGHSCRSEERGSAGHMVEWAALRKVNRVDGSKVKETEPAFEDAFENSPEANTKRLEAMKAESTRHKTFDKPVRAYDPVKYHDLGGPGEGPMSR